MLFPKLAVTSAVLAALPPLTSALNITVSQPNVPFAATPLPPPGAASNLEAIVELFSNLGRTTVWKLVEAVKFQGNTYEPEGIAKIGGNYFVTAEELIVPQVSFNGTTINGTDRTDGVGFAHVMVFSSNGTRIVDAALSPAGALEYHLGGCDFDGSFLWATIAQYRPNSTATVVKIDPHTLNFTNIIHVADHEGGIVHDTLTDDITMLNWGSRNSSTWNLRLPAAPYPAITTPLRTTRNPSYWADYQDCKFLGRPARYNGTPVMLCSGVTSAFGTNIGGVAIVDVNTMVPLMEVPMNLTTALGVQINQNPMDVDVVDGKLRFYFLPDQKNSTLYVYEAQPGSPFEFGGGPQRPIA